MGQMDRKHGTPFTTPSERPDRIVDHSLEFDRLIINSSKMAAMFLSSTETIGRGNVSAFDLRKEIAKNARGFADAQEGQLEGRGIVTASQYRSGYPVHIRDDDSARDRAAFVIAAARLLVSRSI